MAEKVSTDKLLDDLKAVVTDAEELLRATAGQAGEKMSEARSRAEASVRAARKRMSEMQDDEADRLDTAWDLTPQSRLGCQAVIKGDVVCELPMYTRNYVQEGGGIQLGKSERKDRKTQEVVP